jgi:hypothetical protein
MSNDLDQFDPGEDVTDEFDAPRRPTGMVVSVRIGPEESEKLINLAEESGRTVSQVARQAIRSFLSFGAKRNPEVTVSADPQASLVVRTSGDTAPTEGSGARVEILAAV